MTRLLVTGANRGIGLELVKQYAQDGAHVIATCRDPGSATELHDLAKTFGDAVAIETLDVTNREDVAALAATYRNLPIDILINNAGFIGPDPIIENFARQQFGSMDYDLWAEIIRINTFGPVRIAEALIENVMRSEQKKIVCLSSSTGSIGSRRTPSTSYPSSKAALNKSVALLADLLREKSVICVAVCPGHVKTRMGVGGADVEIEDSVCRMVNLIEGLTLQESGSFKRYNGETVPW